MVTGQWPEAAASDVPVDSPFLLRLKGENADGSVYSADARPWLELRAEGSDQFSPVEGLFIGGYPEGLDPLGTLSFVPDEPLAPNTRYEIRAGLLEDDWPQRPEQSASWEITTGAAARAEPLRLEGDWSVDFEPGTEPRFECARDCSPAPCVEVGTTPATKARLMLPGVVGGFSDGHAAGWLRIYVDGTEHPTRSVFVEDARATTELLVTLPLDEGSTYTPCFSYEIEDARGDWVSDDFCAESAFPAPPEPEPELAGDDAEHESDQADQATRSSSSCSVARSPRGAAALPWALLSGLAFASWLTRRRRPKNVP